jgi:hypothetical protein
MRINVTFLGLLIVGFSQVVVADAVECFDAVATHSANLVRDTLVKQENISSNNIDIEVSKIEASPVGLSERFGSVRRFDVIGIANSITPKEVSRPFSARIEVEVESGKCGIVASATTLRK